MKIPELVPTINTCRRLCALRKRPIVNFMWVAGEKEPYVSVVFVDSNEEKAVSPYTKGGIVEFIDGMEFVPAPTVSELAEELVELTRKHQTSVSVHRPDNLAEAFALQVIEIYDIFEPKKDE